MRLPIVPEFADDFFQLIKIIIFGKRYAEINSFLETIESPKSTDPKPIPSDVFRIACDLIDYIPPSAFTPPTVRNTVDNAQYSSEKQEEFELDSFQIRDTEANEQKNAAKKDTVEDTVETDATRKEKDDVEMDMIEEGTTEKDMIKKNTMENITAKGNARRIRLPFIAISISYDPYAHEIRNPKLDYGQAMHGWKMGLQLQIKPRVNNLKLISMKSSGWPD